MKKTIALILALLLALSLLAGCNGGGGGGGTTTPTDAPAATQAPATKAPATKAPAATPDKGETLPTSEPAPAEEDEGPFHLPAGKF